MKKGFINSFKLDFSSLFQPTTENENKARWILLLTPILLTIWVYFGKRFNFTQYFTSIGSLPLPTQPRQFLNTWHFFCSCFAYQLC